MTIKNYKELVVWQKARVLANKVYDLTEDFPKREWFGLAGQMRRGAVSILSNLAEGSQRGGRKEFLHFVTIARGSLAELETQVILSHDRSFIDAAAYAECMQLLDEMSRMQMRLIQSLKRVK